MPTETREVRRLLAHRSSVQLLSRDCQNQPIDPTTRPLAQALAPHREKPAASAFPTAPQMSLGL